MSWIESIIIYADGGCRNNQLEVNIGGWGAILTHSKTGRKELWGGERNTTNNRMEISAAIRALEALKATTVPVEIHMDSAYVVNGMNQWIEGWKARGWKKSNKKPIENKDLWQRLDELAQRQSYIKFIKCAGHSGVELNEIADQLANRAMDEIEKETAL